MLLLPSNYFKDLKQHKKNDYASFKLKLWI